MEDFCFLATFAGEVIDQSIIYQDFTPSFYELVMVGEGGSCRNENFHSEFVVKKLDRKANKTLQCPFLHKRGTRIHSQHVVVIL